MKNLFKFLGIISFIVVFGFVLAACPNDIAVTGVKLNQNSLSLTVGGTATLTATVVPSYAANKAVTWSSSNANVATVNSGTVTAVSAGLATITVTTEDGGKKTTCVVTVTEGGGGTGGDGTFTLTGIPSEHNGKYALLIGYNNPAINGLQSINMTTQTVTLCLISNGRVSIPLWISYDGGNTIVRYSGNNTCEVAIILYSTPTMSTDAQSLGCLELSSVTFSNGSATRSWSQGEYEGGGGGNASDFTYTETANAVTITGYTGAGGNVTIPAQINGKPVTSIGEMAFSSCWDLTSITIPNSVTSIGVYAFVQTGITSITLPNSVTSIGEGAFSYTRLTSVTIPNNVTSIERAAFSNCPRLASVTIPDSVINIGEGAFFNCPRLASITIPNSVTSIGNGAFAGYTGLTSITIPNSVTSIGSQAFRLCTNLASVTIGNSVTSIGDHAFLSCESLTSVTIPNSVTSIGESAFMACTSLTAINMPSGNNAYTAENGVLYNKNKTALICYPAGKTDSSFTIPDSVTSIGVDAFYGCGLTSITIPSSVTTIGKTAVAYCTNLISVTIGNSVTSIEKQAFIGCTSLTSVTFQSTIASNNFDNYFSFPGDLRDKYLTGGIGTYTRASGSDTWTKQMKQ